MGTIFDPEKIHAVAKDAVGLPLEVAFDQITADLAQIWPEHIDTGPRRWIINNAGGAMGQLTLLHASLSEYIMIFGSPIGTGGHSGRYPCDVWDFMISGEMWCYVQGRTEKTIYRPGDMAHLGPGAVKGYRLPESGWMLEYARGPIPAMLPFGMADGFTGTLDLRNLGRLTATYGRHTVRSLLRGKL